jgi:hypothetical protein
MLCLHWWCIYTSSAAIKQAVIEQFGKHLAGKKMPPLLLHFSSSVTLLYLLGDGVSMYPREAD